MGMSVTMLRLTPAELEEILNNSAALEDKIYSEDKDNITDLDKTWDGIIYLLSGQGLEGADPDLIRPIFSGQMVDEEQDLGYGPAHYLTPDQVAEINDAISEIQISEWKAKYNPTEMMELNVYPSIWDEGDEAFEYLADEFDSMQKTYSEAAANGQGLITYIS